MVIRQGTSLQEFEIKGTSPPKITPSMRFALTDLDLIQIDVIHAGDKSFPLSEKSRTLFAHRLLDESQNSHRDD